MSETWCPFAIRQPGAAEKQGYPDGLPNSCQGEIKHSMVGGRVGAQSRLQNPNIRVSWTFSVLQDGSLYQHYRLEAVTWHGGVRYQNQRLIGVEHEGGAPGNESEPLTPAQLATTIRLSRWLKETCRWPDYRRGVQAMEHRDYYATACPSGRIPWDTIIPQVLAEGGRMYSDQQIDEKVGAVLNAVKDINGRIASLQALEDIQLRYQLGDRQAGKPWPGQ